MKMHYRNRGVVVSLCSFRLPCWRRQHLARPPQRLASPASEHVFAKAAGLKRPWRQRKARGQTAPTGLAGPWDIQMCIHVRIYRYTYVHN